MKCFLACSVIGYYYGTLIYTDMNARYAFVAPLEEEVMSVTKEEFYACETELQ